jgi:hypothetical protein
MLNMQIWCMFTDFAMELLQSRIEECLPGFSTHCVRVVHFLMLKIYLNVKVNNVAEVENILQLVQRSPGTS